MKNSIDRSYFHLIKLYLFTVKPLKLILLGRDTKHSSLCFHSFSHYFSCFVVYMRLNNARIPYWINTCTCFYLEENKITHKYCNSPKIFTCYLYQLNIDSEFMSKLIKNSFLFNKNSVFFFIIKTYLRIWSHRHIIHSNAK